MYRVFGGLGFRICTGFRGLKSLGLEVSQGAAEGVHRIRWFRA